MMDRTLVTTIPFFETENGRFFVKMFSPLAVRIKFLKTPILISCEFTSFSKQNLLEIFSHTKVDTFFLAL
jgi:hypothetical protein